tara:strand:- start:1805 stop:2383 length:579 start_codon:yes stop_codon:yes gene_type:complete
MSCGPGLGLSAVQGKIADAVAATDALAADVNAGITSAVSSISSTIDEQVGKVVGGVKEMMPDITLPELNITLPTLSLPDLLRPPVSLQTELTKLIVLLNSSSTFATDAGGLDAQLATLEGIFGDNVDMEAIKADLLSGKLNVDNICELVSNMKKTSDEDIIQLGLPVTAPEIDAVIVAPPIGVPIMPVYQIA